MYNFNHLEFEIASNRNRQPAQNEPVIGSKRNEKQASKNL